MATLCVEYLNGRASHEEWPASPDRLFQAMIATAYSIGQQDLFLPLLNALCETPPAITAPDEPPLTRWQTSVPVAFMPKSGTDTKYVSLAFLRQSARYFPAVGERLKVWYHWDFSDDFAELARNIRYLGKREDLTRCWLDPDPPQPNMMPLEGAETYLAVPDKDRLQDLQKYYQTNVKAPAAPLVGYGEPGAAPSPWGELLLKRPGAVWSLSDAQVLSRCFSRALLAKFEPDTIPPWVHRRHGEAYIPHLACVALPEISDRHSNVRRIVGVGVILPKTPDVDRTLTVRKMASITDMPWDVEGLASLKKRHWCGPSHDWTSVTPVVFPRHGKRPGDLERQLIDLLVDQGYPPPETVELSTASPKPGIPDASGFIRRNPHKPVFHARIRWGQRQAGPVLIGLEAHYGLGLFIADKKD